MSIGIVSTMPGAVLLIADGRMSRPLDGHSVVDDDNDKIYIINDHFALMKFGVEIATEHAIESVRNNLSNIHEIDEYTQVIDNAIEEGWNEFMRVVPSELDISNPFTRAAIVSGGLVNGIPFIAGVLRSNSLRPRPTITTGPYRCLVIGGEEQEAQQYYERKVGEALYRFTNLDDLNGEIFNCILNVARETIQYVSELNVAVGGTIRYVLIRQCLPIARGNL